MKADQSHILDVPKTVREYLTTEWNRRAQGRTQFSMRSFALFLGLNPAELSQVLAGKRVLSHRSALKISHKLGLSDSETQRLLMLCDRDRLQHRGYAALESLPQVGTLGVSHSLSVDAFQVVSHWLCFALLNLLKLTGAPRRPDGMARRLGVSTAEVMQALDRLMRVELVEKKGLAYYPVADAVFSPQGVPSEAIRSYHRSLLQKAIESIESQSIDEREHISLGIAIDPKHLPEFKKELNRVLDTFAQTAAQRSRSKTELYQIQTAFFRLTQKGTQS